MLIGAIYWFSDQGPWAFGWEALVAIGTIGLALATAFLAWTTRKVARETRDVAKATQSEILADWRPVLLVEETRPDSEGNLWPAINVREDGASISVTNCGRGPALDVQVELRFDGDNIVGEPQRVAIAPGASKLLYWIASVGQTEETIEVTQMGRLSYCDLAYSGYQTTFAIKTELPRRLSSLDWQRIDTDPAYEPPLYGP